MSRARRRQRKKWDGKCEEIKRERSNLERGAHQRTQGKINGGESQRHNFKKRNWQIFLCEVYHSLPLVRGCGEDEEECGLWQADDRELGGFRQKSPKGFISSGYFEYNRQSRESVNCSQRVRNTFSWVKGRSLGTQSFISTQRWGQCSQSLKVMHHL